MKAKKVYLISFFLICILVACFNLFLFDWYRVPSNSMAPTLNIGSILLVNKKLDSKTPFGSIFSGTLKLNDILVFQTPPWDSEKQDSGVMFVKRCIGLPGDTILLNHKSSTRKFQIMKGQVSQMFLFPQDTLFRNWTSSQYGPFWVPKKGNSIALSRYNIRLYKKILLYEMPNLRFENDLVLLEGQALKKYTFQEDYYFMLGDNFLQSRDSRFWGCIPKKLLLGKVIWYS